MNSRVFFQVHLHNFLFHLVTILRENHRVTLQGYANDIVASQNTLSRCILSGISSGS